MINSKKPSNTNFLPRIGIYLLAILFFALYSFFFPRSMEIILAATPTPDTPSISDSPDPQAGGLDVTFSSDFGPGLNGEQVKLYVCKDSSCIDCNITKSDAPSAPSFSSSSANVVQVGATNTLAEDNIWGYIEVTDLSTTGAEEGIWTWDFGSSAYGTYYIKWYANVTGTPTEACVGITLEVMASNDGSTWTTIRTDTLEGSMGTGKYWTGQVYLDSITGTYRYIRARIYSNTSCQVDKGYLNVDSVKRSVETTTNCWCTSDFVSSNPSCSYTLPSCCSGIITGQNDYWITSCAWQAIPNISACKSLLGPYTFTCKKEDGCACSASTECFNGTCDTSGTTCCISCNGDLQNTACGTGNGNCEAACGAPSVCDEQPAGTVLAQCDGVGATYFADVCGSGTSCALTDDTSTCRSSAYGSGCTASANCNGLAPNSCPSQATWCSDGSVGTTCTEYDRDSYSQACTSTGSGCTAYTWFSSYTDGINPSCCGDDGANDIFENGGAENSACVEGEVVEHKSNSSSGRYAVFDGEIYFCEDVDQVPDNYDFTEEVLPSSNIMGCICQWDGTWNCTGATPTGAVWIKTFWGRFRIW